MVLGKYTANENEPKPIVWLKGNQDNEFISENILDMLEWDIAGGSNYEASTIYMFMNSADEDLFSTPPAYSYKNNMGFLRDFEGYEIEAIGGEVNLPAEDDVFHPLMNLFKRKGKRTFFSKNYLSRNRYYYRTYEPYWFKDVTGNHNPYNNVKMLSSDGSYAVATGSSYRHGFRPKCKVRGDLKVKQNGDYYYLVPFESNYKKACDIEVFDENDIWSLFGIK